MEFTNNNDVIIRLNIKDHRGKKIRVGLVRDIKIKVWTINPDCALTFDYRDIIQKRDVDELLIRGSKMEVLPSGVITYSYQYKTFDDEHRHNHFHNDEYYEVVVTDIFWKNRYHNMSIDSPTIFHLYEDLKDLIGEERQERIKQDKEIRYFINEEYTNNLNDEIVRATSREKEIEDVIKGVDVKVDENYIELKKKIEDEIKRSQDVDIQFLKEINELDKKYEEKLSNSEKSANEIQSNVDSETQRAKSEEKRIEDKLDAEISRSKAEDTQTTLQIESETTRAKQEEARIETLIENEKNRATFVEENIQTKNAELEQKLIDEIARAKKEEKKVKSRIDELKLSVDVLNGDENVIGSVKHAIKDTEHRFEDEIHKLQDQITGDVNLDGYVTKNELDEIQSQIDDIKENGVIDFVPFTDEEIEEASKS